MKEIGSGEVSAVKRAGKDAVSLTVALDGGGEVNLSVPASLYLRLGSPGVGAFLSDTALPVGEIARRCGFFNKSSFIRMFRRRNGISPGQYRRMIEAGRN